MQTAVRGAWRREGSSAAGPLPAVRESLEVACEERKKQSRPKRPRSSIFFFSGGATTARPSTAHITWFLHGIRILLFVRVGVLLQICQWYRVCDAGALRVAEPLATLLSCAVKTLRESRDFLR